MNRYCMSPLLTLCRPLAADPHASDASNIRDAPVTSSTPSRLALATRDAPRPPPATPSAAALDVAVPPAALRSPSSNTRSSSTTTTATGKRKHEQILDDDELGDPVNHETQQGEPQKLSPVLDTSQRAVLECSALSSSAVFRVKCHSHMRARSTQALATGRRSHGSMCLSSCSKRRCSA